MDRERQTKNFARNFHSLVVKEDKTIDLEYSLIDNARRAIITLVKEFDKKIVAISWTC